MKLHKIFMLLLTVILLMSVLSVLCSAKSPSELAKEYAAEYSDEMEAINEFVGDKADAYSQSLATLSRYGDGEEHTPVPFLINADTSFPYFVYETYIDSDSFESHVKRLADGCFIVENGEVWQQFNRDKGKYIDGGAGGKPIYYDKNRNIINLSFSINGVADYLSDKFDDIDEYKVVGYAFQSSAIRFIYVKSKGTEYLIPFYNNPDWAEFENGKIYTYEELQPLIEPEKAEGQWTDTNGYKLDTDTYNYGGGGEAVSSTESDASQQNNNRSNIVIYIVAGVILLVIIAGITVITVKHKKS